MTGRKRFDVWLANLNPQRGTGAGKVRPVLVIQGNLLNHAHPSTIVCPITNNVQPSLGVLRVHLDKDSCGLKEDSDVLIDQMRAIDNKRFVKRVGALSRPLKLKVAYNLKVVLDLDWEG